MNRRRIPKQKKILRLCFLIVLISVFLLGRPLINLLRKKAPPPAPVSVVAEAPELKSISSSIEEGETLFSIFIKHGLRVEELLAMKKASAEIHPLRNLRPGKSYNINVDENNFINSFSYGIDDDTILKIERVENDFRAQKLLVTYEKRILTINGSIEDNLISAIGMEREQYLLALQVADIFAWDIDFYTDLRKGDTFRVIAEGLYLNGKFRKYGRVLSVEFINNNQKFAAYLYEHSGKADYYDAAGNSLRKAFLKAPLSFRRISSHFSKRRFHPILRIYRPHHGIDYVAPTGTPVSTVGEGRVSFASRKGAYGNLVIVNHPNGYRTYYGHLSRFARGIRRGAQVKQGDLIGYVGATGLATGPHLHYEMRQSNTPINPLRVRNVAGDPVPKERLGEFRRLASTLDRVYEAAIFYDARQPESRKFCLAPELIDGDVFYSEIKKRDG